MKPKRPSTGTRSGIPSYMFKTGVALTLSTALFACIDSGAESEVVEMEQIERTESGQPYVLVGDLGRLAPDQMVADAEVALPTVRAQTNLTPTSELRVRKVEHDQLGMTHVRVSHRKHGLRVVSGEAILHLDA